MVYARLLAEFPPTGGCITSWEFVTIAVDRYSAVNGHVLATAEVVLALVFLCYAARAARQVYTRGYRAALRDPTDAARVLVVVPVGLARMGLALGTHLAEAEAFEAFNNCNGEDKSDEYFDGFARLAWAQYAGRVVAATLVFTVTLQFATILRCGCGARG